jgi:peroxiredoxin
LQENVYGKQIKIYLEGDRMNLAKLKIGDYPYNFSLKDTSGITTEFSSIDRKLILLDFWASGCGLCRLENRAYPKIYEEFKDKGFEIVSVSVDQSKERLKKAMNEDKINWISLWDENRDVYRDLYQIRALPTSYLIYNGKIVAKNITGENLRPKVMELLNNAK